MININSVKDDIFEQALQTRDVKEFANVILNYKDDVTKEDFTLNFHGVTFTTENCYFTNDFLRANKDALLQLDRILEEEENAKAQEVESNEPKDIMNKALKEYAKSEGTKSSNVLDEYLEDFAKGIRSFNKETKEFYLNGTAGFDARIKEIANRIKEINKKIDINSLDLSEKEEKAKEAVENAKAIPDFNTVKEAVDIVDSLDNSDAKDALTNSIITFINNNIDNFEEKEELNNIVSTHTNAELNELDNELKAIDIEIANRKQIASNFKKAFSKTRRPKKKVEVQPAGEKESNQPETAAEVVETTKVSQPKSEEVKAEPVEEKESNQEFISRLESIANDGPIFQDLDLTAGYSLGAYKSAVAKKETEEQKDIDSIIPDLDIEVKEVIKNKIRKITNITKAPVALIEKVRSIDFKSKLNNGLSKIKELASKISEYNNNIIDKASEYSNKIVTEYYTKRMEHAAKQEEKYAEKIEEMASKSSDPDIVVGMSR